MRIRTAILGYGRSGSGMHGVAIEKSDTFDTVAVCDVDVERQKQAGERLGCPVYDDHNRMLGEEELDLVVIVTRSNQHAEMTCDCLNAGVGVLVTKPWALNEAEARRMIEAQSASGKPLLPFLPSRWGCALRRLKELAQEKAVGDIFLIRRVVSSFGTRRDWQTERRYGGGYLLNWGTHIVDPPVLIAGSPVRSVYGRMKQTINPGDVEDVFLAVLNLADGTVVVAEYTMSVEPLPSWLIQGTRGTIVVRDNEIKICKNVPTQPEDPTDFSKMTPAYEETIEETVEGDIYGSTYEVYEEVARAMKGERDFPVRPADALELTRVMDAIRASDEENRVVTLET